ncbi:uncharacterized protein LOC108734901 isoform X1 [Agrilus planipennis]|uniref:Uncharacterized protein LOC108734901 isoform X1 n=1 Tax=Agrilus planipennis TaxID=224129 RepID=A0A1W4WDX2_AGRPL|nr:uncharacterized protein LOC108734901 isoform X1 [Agrilus planipennis]
MRLTRVCGILLFVCTCSIVLTSSKNIITAFPPVQWMITALDVIRGVQKVWKIVEMTINEDGPMSPFIDQTERKIFRKMDLIYRKLDIITDSTDAVGTQTITTILRTLPDRIKLELRVNDLLDYMTRIGVFYRNMRYYANTDDLERHTLEDFAHNVISHDGGSVRSLLERVHAFVASNDKGLTNTGILHLLSHAAQEIEGDMRCNTKQSPQQVLFNLYKSIALTELKGYMMMQFSYMLLKLYNKGNFTKEASIMKERYAERTTAAIQSVKEAMADASREFWRCDPQKHVLNESYIEITNLLQGYVQNEVDLNPEGTCRENCAYYSYTKSHSCYQNLYCQQQRRCNGRIIDCQFIDSDAWVCPADVKSGRRYEYIEYENGRTLGRKQGCPKGPVKVDSWWRWLFWHCSYCFCLCDEESVYSDRYINMRSAIADVVNNRVVTGLRFVKNNRIIHLQIQEGKLLPGGEIDVTTIHWVPVENYRITDKNTFNGQDYHTLTSTEREIDLDDLIADDGHVLTGVRFKKVGQHLNFEIYITPFNFSSGQLIDPLHMSVWKDNLISSRKVLNMEKMDVPIRSPLPSVPDSKSQQVLQFTHTDMDRDASQTTVPFIDAQPVELMIPVPLAGAGIYHKGRPHFGGFIAPKIITYDYSKHLQAGFPEDAEKVH